MSTNDVAGLVKNSRLLNEKEMKKLWMNRSMTYWKEMKVAGQDLDQMNLNPKRVKRGKLTIYWPVKMRNAFKSWFLLY